MDYWGVGWGAVNGHLTWGASQGTLTVPSLFDVTNRSVVRPDKISFMGYGLSMTRIISEAPMRQSPLPYKEVIERAPSTVKLTGSWGDGVSVSSYLDRCQVDTPKEVVQSTWKHVRKLRQGNIGKVIDFGAGDGRFALYGQFECYIGYEIDAGRCVGDRLPKNAKLVNRCAFTHLTADADVCIGNPPFVRNQDIPASWRDQVRAVVRKRTGVQISGLANAWQYFFLNALASVKVDGLVALIVPFEWLSRPAARALRTYIREQQWNVYVYKLREAGFARVLTTASITVVDKAGRDGRWELRDETPNGHDRPLASPTGSNVEVLEYLRGADLPVGRPRAKRGLSPGTQSVLTLTEEQRKRFSLSVDRDVTPCVTSMRYLPPGVSEVDEDAFKIHYVEGGRRCWLIRTDQTPSLELEAYLSNVPDSERRTKTCLGRPEWWRFKMPETPSALFAQGFRGKFPKVVRNTVGAYAVGGVCGIYKATGEQIDALREKLCELDLRDHVVAYSSGFYKVEINQINALLAKYISDGDG